MADDEETFHDAIEEPQHDPYTTPPRTIQPRNNEGESSNRGERTRNTINLQSAVIKDNYNTEIADINEWLGKQLAKALKRKNEEDEKFERVVKDLHEQLGKQLAKAKKRKKDEEERFETAVAYLTLKVEEKRKNAEATMTRKLLGLQPKLKRLGNIERLTSFSGLWK